MVNSFSSKTGVEMRFVITMHMPSRNAMRMPGAPTPLVHQVLCEHRAESLEQFENILADAPFVTVEELYKDQDRGGYFSVGPVILNTMHVGKVKEMQHNNPIEKAKRVGE
jgi:hypothetical protein